MGKGGVGVEEVWGATGEGVGVAVAVAAAVPDSAENAECELDETGSRL